MTFFLKIFRLHNSCSHVAWAFLSDEEGSAINITEPLLEQSFPLEEFLVLHSQDSIITFDGEYLLGRYSHVINSNSVIGLDILFYLTEMQKFSIGNFLYRFGDYGIGADVFSDHRSLSPQDFLDNSAIVRYLNQYCHLAKRFIGENHGFIDTVLSDQKLMNFYTNIQPKICENVYRFNSNRLEFDTSSKSTQKLMKEYGDYITKIRRHGNHMYPNYYSLSVVTGRLGFFGELNPMVLPKEIRSLIMPSNDSIIALDARNAEPRMVFELSDTPMEHDDVYNGIVEVMGINSLDREGAKSMWFNFVYGNGVMKQSTTIRKMTKAFPEISSFINKLIDRASKESVMHSFFGRRLPKFSGEEYKIVNHYIQSTFTDFFQLVVNKMFKKMDENKKKSKILCTIQDEFLLDVCIEEVEDIMRIVNDSVADVSEEFGISDEAIRFEHSILKTI